MIAVDLKQQQNEASARDQTIHTHHIRRSSARDGINAILRQAEIVRRSDQMKCLTVVADKESDVCRIEHAGLAAADGMDTHFADRFDSAEVDNQIGGLIFPRPAYGRLIAPVRTGSDAVGQLNGVSVVGAELVGRRRGEFAGSPACNVALGYRVTRVAHSLMRRKSYDRTGHRDNQ